MSRRHDPNTQDAPSGVTRRGFLSSVGAGAVVAAAGVAQRAEAVPEITAPEDMVRVDLRINGKVHRLLVEPRWTLLFVLRERLGLTGTKVGCERGECGACTVLIDDQPRYACLTLAVEAQDHDIVTLEGLMQGEDLGAVQQAFVENDAFQCGYCTPGMILTAYALLLENPKPSTEEITQTMEDILCRCSSYNRILDAIKAASQSL